MGIATGISQQYISRVENKKQQKSLNNELTEQKNLVKKIGTDLLQSQLSQEYMKGQLNAIGLLIGKSNDNVASAIEKMAQSYTQTITVTKKQICSNTMDLVRRMQKFEYDRRVENDQLWSRERSAMMAAKTEQEKSQIWQQYNTQSSQQSARFDYKFKTTLLGEAIYLRNELLRRLPPQPEPAPDRRLFAFEGILVGPSPVADAAIYLETLSKKLCPN